MVLPSRVEAFLGRLLKSQRGRDAKLLTRAAPALSALPPALVITSPQGASPAVLDVQHTPLGANIFPELAWTLPTDGTVNIEDIKSWLIVVEDPDAPTPFPIVHGLYYGIPPAKMNVGPDDFSAAEGGSTDPTLLVGGFKRGANWSGKVWSGPKPVLGHGPHRYFFQVVGLKEELPAVNGKQLKKDQLVKNGTLDGKVAVWGEWIGEYERKLEPKEKKSEETV